VSPTTQTFICRKAGGPKMTNGRMEVKVTHYGFSAHVQAAEDFTEHLYSQGDPADIDSITDGLEVEVLEPGEETAEHAYIVWPIYDDDNTVVGFEANRVSTERLMETARRAFDDILPAIVG